MKKEFGRAAASRRRAIRGSASAPTSPKASLASPPLLSLSRESLFDFEKIPRESKDIIKNFDKIAEAVRPLNSKQRQSLPADIKNLSHDLTDTRGNRRIGYMNSHQEISAYINYFLWWNLVRLVPIFAGLDDTFSDENGAGEIVALDIGSGPLTIPIALWLARPELREKKIKFYCLDMSQNALAVGEELFLKIAAKTLVGASRASATEQAPAPWKIVRVKGELGCEIKEKADLIFSANVFNEVIQNETKPLDFLAKKNSDAILKYAKENTKIFITEPGVPRSARFLSLVRDSLLRKNFAPIAPCPHAETCPMQGRTPQGRFSNKSEKWCNFAFSTETAPERLLKLSERANLKKDRAVLSFIFMEHKTEILNRPRNKFGVTRVPVFQHDTTLTCHPELVSGSRFGASVHGPGSKTIPVRVCSDSIFIPYLKKSGFYCCSEKGLLLLVGNKNLKNGDLTEIKDFDAKKCPRDEKSGAMIEFF